MAITEHAQKLRLNSTQLENVRFMEVNELKLTQVELFQFFHFMGVAANKHFLYPSILSF